MSIRNIAIIAHVDHGKTTLVDALLKQGGAFAAHEKVGELVMDSNAQERERGITIYAKNASIQYKDCRINIVDTPGHADFGSEVERVLRTVDSVLLLVDAQEGPMPQTKFVLKKSLELGLRPIVIMNKIDKPAANPLKAVDRVFDLFVQLGASNEQLDFPCLFTIAREGIAKRSLEDESKDLTPLFETIMTHVPAAAENTEVPFRMQPSNLVYDNFVGRLAVGRVYEGMARAGDKVWVKSATLEMRAGKITKIFVYRGIERMEAEEAAAGNIVIIAGIPDINVGETITTNEWAEPLPAIRIDPPTVSMTFSVNSSPFAGRDGKLLTTRHIRERLLREAETNVGLRMEEIPNSDSYKVSGRGELHLSVLLEQMRRDGFELEVARPEVIFREENGVKEEPVEHVVIDVPEPSAGTVIDLLSRRKGELMEMRTEAAHTRMEFTVPTRGLLGFRGAFIIETRGEGFLNHSFLRYEPFKGELPGRNVGSIISMLSGTATAYDLWKLQERGQLFIGPQTALYEGMIIGENAKDQDIVVNVTRGKKLTNMRASGSDEAINLTPVKPMILEQALEYIGDDELVEITPSNVRLRKRLLLEHERKRSRNAGKG
ncbi:GTP-binding protein TypA [Candidatus Peribacteria bacterium RIFCSPLOWO2_12_FULL_55_15]|nr:MAG: GTP-binding protein TypA [Candidatus Peribacteria bacterium RIFCSPHIGHO2_01_FULL_54_22]OGJ63469.1 MAG: GTP-binding protein TypA [Candidatus Peribacteria bacterium RIFCSPHIGHO2_02_FULL_55_24]OGJ64717.1 MAG: GTP-binding protein TypA [Candidatus Peribacteria bacterium RIFCSPHIGHO2_12_FULL_54_10]OGJ67325.1 MAG: GTP-binding protein TypA [Candidatus Peribacteria bacterium RIFCSPLOWO2_01_FULL_54_110]OGJ68749.1 MAG: GTP-binding protein TypA [Candidatus Peribacteria bacterium RIFCSPLOWO2_02_FULL